MILTRFEQHLQSFDERFPLIYLRKINVMIRNEVGEIKGKFIDMLTRSDIIYTIISSIKRNKYNFKSLVNGFNIHQQNHYPISLVKMIESYCGELSCTLDNLVTVLLVDLISMISYNKKFRREYVTYSDALLSIFILKLMKTNSMYIKYHIIGIMNELLFFEKQYKLKILSLTNGLENFIEILLYFMGDFEKMNDVVFLSQFRLVLKKTKQTKKQAYLSISTKIINLCNNMKIISKLTNINIVTAKKFIELLATINKYLDDVGKRVVLIMIYEICCHSNKTNCIKYVNHYNFIEQYLKFLKKLYTTTTTTNDQKLKYIAVQTICFMIKSNENIPIIELMENGLLMLISKVMKSQKNKHNKYELQIKTKVINLLNFLITDLLMVECLFQNGILHIISMDCLTKTHKKHHDALVELICNAIIFSTENKNEIINYFKNEKIMEYLLCNKEGKHYDLVLFTMNYMVKN